MPINYQEKKWKVWIGFKFDDLPNALAGFMHPPETTEATCALTPTMTLIAIGPNFPHPLGSKAVANVPNKSPFVAIISINTCDFIIS